MESKKDDASSKLGVLLLKGWTMMEEACYDCNVPLMKNKQNELLCVNCNAIYLLEKGKLIKQLNQQTPVPTVPQGNAKKDILKSDLANIKSKKEVLETILIPYYKQKLQEATQNTHLSLKNVNLVEKLHNLLFASMDQLEIIKNH